MSHTVSTEPVIVTSPHNGLLRSALHEDGDHDSVLVCALPQYTTDTLNSLPMGT